MTVYFDDGKIKIRSMVPGDAKALYATYESYGWHPRMEIYERYYKEQEEGSRLVFIAEYEGRISGQCTLDLHPEEGSQALRGFPEIVDLTVFFDVHGKGIGSRLLDAAEAEAGKISGRVFLAVGLHSGYGAAQRIYAKRGYIPDGSGVYYRGKVLEQYAPCVNDDDLLLFLSKDLGKNER
ncbi:MAG TPA: N-acetyltransferase [Treponema sp.]|nr:N-acetyltransferase [Treponema sp.]